ncbi:MAG: MotA/TolQ/ExbB proton channel family protein [Pseudomonadota bacterium]
MRTDIATVSGGLGLLGLWGLWVWLGVATGDGRAFWQPRILLWVWGGAGLSLLVQFSPQEIARGFQDLASVLVRQEPAWHPLVNEAAQLADLGRRRQHPGLEEAQITDPLLSRGVKWLVDGYDNAALQTLWADDALRLEERFTTAQRLLRALALAATSLGLLGAMMELIHAFLVAQEPSRAGASLALALVAVFYGGLLAFLVAQPLSGRLEQAQIWERRRRAVALEAVLAIQQGISPHLLFQRLSAQTLETAA